MEGTGIAIGRTFARYPKLATPRGTAARAFFPWDGGRVRLRFGRGEQAREVAVRNERGAV